MSTIMMHRYQNILLKWTILGNDLGQWQLHIIYNFLVDLYKLKVIFIDLYHQCVWNADKIYVIENEGGVYSMPPNYTWMLIDLHNIKYK